MTTRLKTSKVFLDTETFVRANFQFNSGNLKRLSDLIYAGKISLHLTDITIREIKANISKKIQEFNDAIKKLQKTARIPRDIPSFANLFNPNIDIGKEWLENQFNTFINLTQTNIISTQNVSVVHIFDKYFSKVPPFGEGKKKNEFPDAFVIKALEDYCEEEEVLMYVISDDKDMISACSSNKYLISLQSLDALFDLITAEDELSELAHQWLEENKKTIEQEVTNKLEALELNYNVYTTDSLASIDRFTVESVKFIERKLVEIKEETLDFNLKLEANLSIKLSYIDIESMVIEPENEYGELVAWKTIEKTIERNAEILVDVKISFSRNMPHNAKVIAVQIDPDIEIQVKNFRD